MLRKNEKVDSFFTVKKLSFNEQQALKSFIFTKDTEILDQVFKSIRFDLENNYRAIIVEMENEDSKLFDFHEIQTLNPLIASYFGNLLIQNEKNDKVISVFDRDRAGSMYKGARYHQTREGGSIHTDNVNTPEIWDYLYFSCLSPGLIGGENILVDGIKVHQKLQKDFPQVLKTLENNFYWEMRGLTDQLYQAPIITYNDKAEPLFRHLRPYMESAHERASLPLNPEQLFALDVLDAITNSSEFQVRYRMKKNDLLLTKDAQVLHGRTCFSDDLHAINLTDYLEGQRAPIKRTMERIWIKK